MTDHWWDEAQCFGLDQDFDRIANSGATEATKDKRYARLCAGCPVLRECAADVLHYEDKTGGRAGMLLKPLTKSTHTTMHPLVRARLEAIVYGTEAISA